ncbi:site-specific integrase, partial [Bacillus thuringiensis]|nr:site-specific integrase [Bacillus thuringiensis]
LIDAPHKEKNKMRLDFNPWTPYPNMLVTIKNYIAFSLLSCSFNTVFQRLECLRSRFLVFIKDRPEIESFKDITNNTLKSYFEYLLETRNSRTGNKLNGQYVYMCALVVKDILVRGVLKGWAVPADSVYTEHLFEEIIINNPRVKKEKSFSKASKKLPSDTMINQILHNSQKTDDILIGASVILSSQIGLRINEILTIKADCLQVVHGSTMIEVPSRKTRNETIYRLIPANNLVIEAVNKALSFTRELREKSGSPYLFLVKSDTHGTIKSPAYGTWQSRLKKWIKNNNFRENGELVNLSFHYFRHIFATHALKQGMRVEEVSEIMDHTTLAMTETYLHVEEHVRNRFAEVISNSPIAGKKAMELKRDLSFDNPFKGKTTDDVEKLRKSLKIQIMSHGMCLHHPMTRERCDGDGVCLGCNNYLTTIEFLPIHQARLDKIRAELKRTIEGPFADKLQNMANYLEDIISQLNSQSDNSNSIPEIVVGSNDHSEYI